MVDTNNQEEQVLILPDISVSELKCDTLESHSKIASVGNDSWNNALTVLHINIRSLRNKYDDLKLILTDLGYNPSVLVISETWLRDCDADYFNLPGYLPYLASRNNGIGGGVAVYISKGFDHNLVAVHNTDYYSVWLEVVNFGSLKKCMIGGYYRPPQFHVQDFLKALDTDLNKFGCNNAIIAGDFNININEQSCVSTLYRITCNGNGFSILNSIPTRTTDTSSTIIDHVVSNLTNVRVTIHTINNPISDHCILIFKTDIPQVQSNKVQHKIDTPKLMKFIDKKLKNFPFIASIDVNFKVEFIVNALSNSISEATIVTASKKKYKYNMSPWASTEFLELVRERDKLYKKYKKKSYNVCLKQQLNDKNNQITNMKRQLYSKYYVNKFHDCRGNSNVMWKTINEILGKTSRFQTVPETIISSAGETLDNPTLIADKFCDHFANVGQSLSSSIISYPTDHINKLQTLSWSTSNFFLSPVNEEEIALIINGLQKNSPGHDHITATIVKQCKHLLLPLLVEVINQSFISATYPNILKIAKVIPLFKAGDRKVMNNYRPISVLSVIDKIFERTIKTRLVEYLEQKQILYAHQYGFRKNLNTTAAALSLLNNIRQAVDHNKFSSAIFIDLCKAFDMVNHEILLEKLEYYGIRGIPLKLIESYLSNRTQIVKIGGFESDLKPIKLGVPQGSVLGPILFLIYLNDLGNLKLNGMPTLFADDTVLSYDHSVSLKVLLKFMQEDLNTLSEYLRLNKLSINSGKTNYVIFCSPHFRYEDLDITLKIDNAPINKVSCVKYLGLYIDEHLKWNVHISKIINKILPIVGVLRRLGGMPIEIKKSVYNAFINSHLQYLSAVWGIADKTYLYPLQLIQNRAIKCIFNLNYFTPTKEIYASTNILPIRCIYEFNVIKFIHTHSEKATKITSIHDHNTRCSNGIYLHPVNTEFGKKASTFHGFQLFNKLPIYIRNISSPKLFKRFLKERLQTKFMSWEKIIPY